MNGSLALQIFLFLIVTFSVWIVLYLLIRSLFNKIRIAKEKRLRDLEILRQQEVERLKRQEAGRERIRLEEQARRNSLQGRSEAAVNSVVDGVAGTAEAAINVVKVVGQVGLTIGSLFIGSKISNLTGGGIYVDPYRRKDGTRVKGHWRKRD